MIREDSLIHVVLQGDAAGDSSVPNQQRDREQATRDLRVGSHFAPVELTGPFILHLSVNGGRLVLDGGVQEVVSSDLVRTIYTGEPQALGEAPA